MTIAIIDGDIPCYQCFPPRWESKQKMLSLVDGVVISQDIVQLDATGDYIIPQFTEEEDLRYIEKGWENFKRQHQKLLDDLWTTDFLMAVKGAYNFRDQLYDEYKKPRHRQASKPTPYTLSKRFVPAIRKRAVKEDYAIFAHGREADDYIRIWAEECRHLGKDYVICSIDKDLRCIPGKHWLMHPGLKDSERLIEVTEEDALRFYYKQILMGDSTDNIPGISGLGPKTADKILAPFKTDEEFQEAVVDAYFKVYGKDDWFSYLNINAKLIHIQKFKNDYCDLMQWPLVKELL